MSFAPGVLHLDVTQGCTASSMCSALLDLGVATEPMEIALASLGFADVKLQRLAPVMTLEDLQNHLQQTGLDLIPKQIAMRALEILAPPLAGEAMRREVATQLLSDIVAFTALIAELSPLAVTATRVPISWPQDSRSAYWHHCVLEILAGVPTYEREWPAPSCDVAGAAVLKAVVSRFGPRGNSCLVRMGLGPDLMCRAMWCEPSLMATRATEGPSSLAQVEPALQIQGLVGVAVDLDELFRRLVTLGARNITTSQVLQDGKYPKTNVCAYVPQSQLETAAEALLVTGESEFVIATGCEQHALRQRIVSVPLGRGQSIEYCRVVESLFGEKIVRAQPDDEDLTVLIKQTGFAQDVVRGDVLASWRRWRTN